MSEDIDIGSISEALNGKADRDWNNLILPNEMATKLNNNNIKTVVETYRNGSSWYRRWSDGWIEQGGRMPKVGTSATVNLITPFATTDYTITSVESDLGLSDTEGVDFSTIILLVTTTSFKCSTASGRTPMWYACGF